MNPVFRLPCVQRLLPAAVLLAASLSCAAAERAPVPTRPNVVFILADDLGWADLGVYGQTFAETPHLDRLAAQGLRFTHAYAPAPICSASRAAILTGRSPARLHFEFVTKPRGSEPPPGTKLVQPPFPENLPLEEITLAEALAPAGYTSGFFGKWHLTEQHNRYLGHGDTFGPRQQGFAVTSEERGSHPYNYPAGGKKNPGFGDFAPGEFAPDALTDEAIDFLRKQRGRSGEPFLLFLSHYYVHDPVHTRCRWLLDKYRAKARRLGRVLDDDHLRYAAFVDTMDHLVGRVLTALDELGLAENSLVIFTSDNGGHPRFADNGLRGSKWTLYEGGVRVPWLVRWPGVVPAGGTSDVPIVGTDLLPTLCELAGVPAPADRALDGTSLLALFAGAATTLGRDMLVWHFPFYHPWFVGTTPVSSLRRGDLKLLYFHEDQRAELYDLAADPQEQHDLAAARPDDAATLRTALFERLRAAGARLPQPR
ncbi:MAG TPA: sulfatase [Opitutaceae bacterium]